MHRTTALSPGAAIGLIVALALPTPAPAQSYDYIGMDGITITTLAVDEAHDRLLVGTIEGFWVYDLLDGTWSEHDDEDFIGREVGAILAHPTIETRVITGRVNAFFKGYVETSDTFSEVGDYFTQSNGGLVTGLVADPADPDHLLACTLPDVVPGELLTSTDGGETWSLDTVADQFGMTSVAVDADGVVYLAGDAPITRSDDGGATWSVWSDGLPGGVARAVAAYSGPDEPPTTGHLVHAGFDGGLYVHDGTGPWTEVLDAPIHDVWAGTYAIEVFRVPHEGPRADARRGEELTQYVIASTQDGRLFYSEYPTLGHEDFTGTLAGLEPRHGLVTGSYLYVATRNRGVYRLLRTVDVPSTASTPPALAVAPNPIARGAVSIRFELLRSGRVTLDVLDVTGRRVARITDAPLAAGSHRVSWNAEAAGGAGVWFLRLETPSGVTTRRLVRTE